MASVTADRTLGGKKKKKEEEEKKQKQSTSTSPYRQTVLDDIVGVPQQSGKTDTGSGSSVLPEIKLPERFYPASEKTEPVGTTSTGSKSISTEGWADWAEQKDTKLSTENWSLWAEQGPYLRTLQTGLDNATWMPKNTHIGELNQNMIDQGLHPIFTSDTRYKPYYGQIIPDGNIDSYIKAAEDEYHRRNEALQKLENEWETSDLSYDEYERKKAKAQRGISEVQQQIKSLQNVKENQWLEDLPSDVTRILNDLAVAHDNYDSVVAYRSTAPSSNQGFEVGRPSWSEDLDEPYEEIRSARQKLKNMGYSDEEIDRMYNAYKNIYNDKIAQEWRQMFQAAATDMPILTSAGSVVSSLLGGVTGLAGAIVHPGERNNPTFQGFNLFTSTTRDTVKTNIEESVRSKISDPSAAGFWSKLAGFGYSAATSALDSAAAMGTGAVLGVPILGEAILGAGAASQQYNDMLNNGFSAGEALFGGFVSGAIETLTEHVSLEKLRWLQASGQGLKNLPLNLVKQFVTEGSEEIASDILNEAFDYYAHGGLSKYYQFVTKYLDEHRGATEAEARTAYAKDFGMQLVESGVIGGLSGAMGAGRVGVQNTFVNRQNDLNTGLAYQADRSVNGQDAYLAALDAAYNLGSDSKARRNLVDMGQSFVNAEGETQSRRETRKQGKAINSVLSELNATTGGKAVARSYQERFGNLYGNAVNRAILRKYGVDEKTVDPNSDEALMKTAQKLGLDSKTTENLLKVIDNESRTPALQQFVGLEEALRYGKAGIDLTSGSFADSLTNVQRETAAAIGRNLTAAEVEQRQKTLDKAYSEMVKSENVRINGKVQTVSYVGELSYNDLNETQKPQVDYITEFANQVGRNRVIFYASKLAEDGKTRVFAAKTGIYEAGTAAPNAFYDHATGDVYVDINAGDGGQGYMLFHAAHEYGHHIAAYAPAKFQKMCDFLVKEVYGNETVKDLIDAQMAKAAADGRVMTETEAQEEMFADAMQEMFTQGNIEERLAKLKGEDRSLWQQFKDFVSKLLADIKAIYKKVQPESEEARLLKQNMDAFEKIADMFTEASVEAGQKFEALQRENTEINGDAIVFAEHAPEDQEIFGLGKSEDNRRQTTSDGGTGAVGSDADRAGLGTAGLKFSSRALGASEIENAAVEHFGTTEDYRVAGYVLRDGRMLDFSGAHWLEGESPAYIATWREKNDIRQVDHEDIFEAYEQSGGDFTSDSALDFMKKGNIRIVPEAPGIDVYSDAEPTAEQYARIQDYIRTATAETKRFPVGKFTVDITKSRKARVGSIHYTGNINAERIVNDLKHYFATGEIREQSDVDRFRYSARDASYMKAVEDGDMDTAQRMVDEAAKAAGYGSPKVYHGTETGGFFEFRGKYHWFTEDVKYARTMAMQNADGTESTYLLQHSNHKSKVYAAYLSTKNPYILNAEGQTIDGLSFDDYFGAGKEKEQELFRALEAHGYDSVIVPADAADGAIYVVFSSSQIKSADPVTYDDDGNVIPLSERFNPEKKDIRFSGRNLAPTFYSQLERTVDNMKMDKIGASSVVSFLKGRGVKDEEIKWSGIRTFLEGKKSVTKAELQQFLKENEIRIEIKKHAGRSWDSNDYEQYRKAEAEALESAYQDSESDPYSMFDPNTFEVEYDSDIDGFIVYGYEWEEGEDYSNSERKEVYRYEPKKGAVKWQSYTLRGGGDYREYLYKLPGSEYSNDAMRKHWGEEGVIAHARVQEMGTEVWEPVLFVEEIQSDWHNAWQKAGYGYIERMKRKGYETAPDAPYAGESDSYVPFVLKNLLREAAEKGYDYLGWTTAQQQADRWGEQYSEGYRIEYDQEIPKFLKKYGKQWGANVEDIRLSQGDTVHAMKITDAMRDSVLYEGQASFSARDTDGTDARTMLSNALLETAQTDAERDLLERYQAKIGDRNKDDVRLGKIRDQIREMMFAKGPRDAAYKEKLAKLNAQAKILSDRIARADKKLLEMESTKPLKKVVLNETKKAAENARVKAEMDLIKAAGKEYNALQSKAERLEKKAARLEADIEHRKEMRQKGIDQRASRDAKARINAIRKDLEQRLKKGNERTHIPAAIAQEIIDICVAIDPTGEDQNTKAAQKYRDGREALLRLRAAYDAVDTSADSGFSDSFRAEFSKSIGELATAIGDTPLREMNREQLEALATVMAQIRHIIINANKLIGAERAYDIATAKQNIRDNMADVLKKGLNHGIKDDSYLKRKVGEALTWQMRWFTNPLRMVKEVVGYDSDSTLYQLFNAINEGRKKGDFWLMTAKKTLEDLSTGKENRKKYTEAAQQAYNFGLKDMDGKDLKLSKMQAMTLLLLYEREQKNNDRRHLEAPSYILNIEESRKGDWEKARERAQIMPVMTEEMLQKLRDGVSDEWSQRYMEAARKVFNELSSDAINEVSMQLLGRPIATEEAYIPYEINDDFLKGVDENISFDRNILNAGFTKALVKNAPQPLVIRGLNEVLDRHIQGVATYYGTAIPVYNWNKVFGSGEYNNTPVREAVRQTWDSKTVKAIRQAVADAQGPRPGDTLSLFEKIKRNWVQATLAFNLSVAMKQAASYPTAGFYLSAKALRKGAPYFAKSFSEKQRQAIFDEIDKHTAELYVRRTGIEGSQEMAEFSRQKNKIKELSDKAGNLSPFNWIQAIDVKTTAALWVATKAQVELDGTKPGADDYWQKVSELYETVIENTQPMYDPMHRAEITKNKVAQNFIVFQTQPLQNSGILREAYFERKAAKKKFGKDSKELKAANKKFRMAVTSQLTSHLVFSLMTAIAAVVKHRVDPWRDDDDELTLESIAKKIGLDFLNADVGAVIPVFGSYASSLLERVLGGTKYDVLSDPVVDQINSVITALQNLENPSYKTVTNAVSTVLALFGMPAGNAQKIAEGIYLHGKDLLDGKFLSFEAGVDRTTAQQRSRLYKALLNGDAALVSELRKEAFPDEKTYHTAIQTALKDNEARLVDAVTALEGDDLTEYRRILEEIEAEGIFSLEDITAAARSMDSTFDGHIKNAKAAELSGDDEAYRKNLTVLLEDGYDEDFVLQRIAEYEPDEEDPYSQEVQWLSSSDAKAFLYKAMQAGDTANVNFLKQQYETEYKFHNAVRAALRENDPRIRQAAEARLKGDTARYVQIVKAIVGERHFSQDDVVKAVNSESQTLKKESESTAPTNTTPWWEDETDGDYDDSYGFKRADLGNAFLTGDETNIGAVIDDLVDDKLDDGVDQEAAEKSAASTVKSSLKTLYVEGSLDQTKTTEYLKTYTDLEDDDVYWTFREWDYAKDHSGSSDGYGKYNDFYSALETGKDLKNVIREYLTHGVKASTVASQITSHYKPLYLKMTNTERAALKARLLNAYTLLGYNYYSKSKDIDKWLK